MIVDCEICPAPGQRCEDCVVTALFISGSSELPLDAAETRAVDAFVRAGLVSVEASWAMSARREPMEKIGAVG
jgi:hypothetical protein